MVYPHILLVFILVVTSSVSAAESASSKTKIAEYLTVYYELRVIEVMALRKVLEQSDPSSFAFSTNKGFTTVVIKNLSAKKRQIQITTSKQDQIFRASFYCDTEKNLIVKRIEHQ